MAEPAAGEDADHHRRHEGGFVGGVADGRQALAAPPAQEPGGGEEAGRVRESVPMDAAQAPTGGEMDRDRVEVVDPGAERRADHGVGFAGPSPAPLRPRR